MPDHALREHDVLVEGDERAEGVRGELLGDQRGGGAVARHDLVGDDLGVDAFVGDLLGGLTKSQDLGLREEVAHEQVVHGTRTVRRGEVLTRAGKANKVSRDEVSALVHELEEGMLAVGARLAEVNLAGVVVHILAAAAHGLAVGLHGQLLQVRREAGEILGVGEHGVRLRTQEVGVPDAEQTHEDRNVLLERRGAEVLIHGMHASEELAEVLRADGGHERQANGGVNGVAAAHPVPESKHVRGIDAELGDLLRVGGHGDEVLGDGLGIAVIGLEHPAACRVGVGEGFLRGEGLGGDDKQGGLRIEIREVGRHIGGVDVGDEARLNIAGEVGAQCLVGHGRAEVRAANTDIDDGLNLLTGVAGPGAVVQGGDEAFHAVEHFLDIGVHVLAIDGERGARRSTQCGMEDGAVLGGVEVLARKHLVAGRLDARRVGHVEERVTHSVVDEVLRQIDVPASGVERPVLRAVGICGEELTQIRARSCGELGESVPLRVRRNGHKAVPSFAYSGGVFYVFLP